VPEFTQDEQYRQLLEMVRGYLDGINDIRMLAQFCVPFLIESMENALLNEVMKTIGVVYSMELYPIEESKKQTLIADTDLALRKFIGYHIPTN
jgi:hypothetical protein